MPGKAVAPGFFGKVPRSGDFVMRRLDANFVTFWDQFIAKNIVPLMTENAVWPENGLRFLLGDGVGKFAAHVGLIVPSCDTIGRLFPLTIASPFELAAVPKKIATWFAEITGPSLDAAEGLIDIGELDMALSDIALPELSQAPDVPLQLIVPGLPPFVTDFSAPSGVFRQILRTKVGAV